MLKNTRIFVRLAALAGMLLLLMSLLAATGISSMASIHEGLRTVYEDRVIPMQQLRTVTENYYRLRNAVLAAIASNDAAVVKQQSDAIRQAIADSATQWKAYNATYLTPEESRLAAAAQTAFDHYDAVRGNVLKLLASGDFAGARALAGGEGATSHAAVMQSLDDLSKLQVDVAASEYEKANGVFTDNRALLLGSLGLALLVGAAAAWLTPARSRFRCGELSM